MLKVFVGGEYRAAMKTNVYQLYWIFSVGCNNRMYSITNLNAFFNRAVNTNSFQFKFYSFKSSKKHGNLLWSLYKKKSGFNVI